MPPEFSFDSLRSSAGLGESFALAAPMMGDVGGFCARRAIGIPSTQTFITTIPAPSNPGTMPSAAIVLASGNTVKTTVPSTQCVIVCDPLTARIGSGFKIADDDSPCPQDRVFFTYNYFDNLSGAGGFTPKSTVPLGNNSQTIVDVPGVAAAARNTDLNRELFGVEKTFLGGDASVELRVPFFQATGDGSVAASDFGDLTAIIKFALLHDASMGYCLSGGLAVTVPTGPSIVTIDGTIHDVLFQPFVAGLWSRGDFFVQGFTSLVVPTDARDVTLLFNDVGMGYTVYHGSRDGYISYVAPALEVHVTSPLDHFGSSYPISISDIVDLTPGVYIGVGQRSVLSLGMAIPVTGPRPFNLETLVQLNYRF